MKRIFSILALLISINTFAQRDTVVIKIPKGGGVSTTDTNHLRNDIDNKLDAISITKTTDATDTIHKVIEVAKGIETQVGEIRTPQPITLKAVGVVNIDSLANREYQIRVNTSNDSTLTNADSVSVPTAWAVKNYVSNHGGGADANAVHKTGNESIADIKNFTGKIGVNNTNPLAPIHVGNSNINNSTNAQILVSGNVDNTITGNGHAFADGSQITRSGNIGYASYDGRVNILGANSFDHYVSFQAAPTFGGTGTISNIYGLKSLPTISSGTVTNNYGVMVDRAVVSGTGSIINDYGIFINAPIAGITNNYSIYSNGAAKSYFGGPISVGKVFNSYSGFGGSIDLQGNGPTIHRASESSNTYLFSVFDSANTPKAWMQLSSSNNILFNNVTVGKYIAFYTDNAANLALVLSGGKAGIGKVPTVPLDVVGTAKFTDKVSYTTHPSFLASDSLTHTDKKYVDSLIFQSLPKSAFSSLKSSGLLLPGKYYKITNATSLSLPIYVFATSANTIDSAHVIVPGYSYSAAVYNSRGDTLVLTDRIFGVIRCSNGIWSYISDPNHDRENLDSINIDAAGNLYCTFKKQNYYTGVGDVIAQVDNNYPYFGIQSGTSVGTNLFFIHIYRSFNIQDSIYWNGTFYSVNSNVSDSGDIVKNITDSVVVNADSSITVYQRDTIPNFVANYPHMQTYPVVQGISDGYTPRILSVTPNSFKVKFYDFSGTTKWPADIRSRFIYTRTALNRQILGSQGYKTYTSQNITNIWIQGWVHKTIQ